MIVSDLKSTGDWSVFVEEFNLTLVWRNPIENLKQICRTCQYKDDGFKAWELLLHSWKELTSPGQKIWYTESIRKKEEWHLNIPSEEKADIPLDFISLKWMHANDIAECQWEIKVRPNWMLYRVPVMRIGNNLDSWHAQFGDDLAVFGLRVMTYPFHKIGTETSNKPAARLAAFLFINILWRNQVVQHYYYLNINSEIYLDGLSVSNASIYEQTVEDASSPLHASYLKDKATAGRHSTEMRK